MCVCVCILGYKQILLKVNTIHLSKKFRNRTSRLYMICQNIDGIPWCESTRSIQINIQYLWMSGCSNWLLNKEMKKVHPPKSIIRIYIQTNLTWSAGCPFWFFWQYFLHFSQWCNTTFNFTCEQQIYVCVLANDDRWPCLPTYTQQL